MLSRLGLIFSGTHDIRDKGHMDKQAVFSSHFQGELTNRLQKRLAFDIACGSADFCDDDICFRFFPDGVNEILDFIRDMRNYLYRLSQIVSMSLFVENIPVDFA